MAPTATARATSRVLPFGLPQLHVGTDVCHVSRVYAILKKAKPASSSSSTPSSSSPLTLPKQTTASRFIRRILTPPELDALGPAPSTTLASLPGTMTAHAAVAWLAKGAPLPYSAATGTNTTTPDDTSPLWRAAQFLAGRFAAKEAAIKAHPHLPGLTLQDVRIARRRSSKVQHVDDVDDTGDTGDAGDAVVRRRNANSGPPLAYVRVYSLEKDSGGGSDGGSGDVVEQEARISISHDGEYATAVCLGIEHT